MRISRVFTDQQLAPGQRVKLDDRAGHYLARVLKLRSGDPLVLFNGDGADYAGEVDSMERSGPVIAVHTRLPAMAESPLELTLVQAISRGERMDQTLQKATELGVSAVQPLLTRRVEVRLSGARLEKRMAHWRGVISSACQQCGRAILPELRAPLDLDTWLSQATSSVRLALDPAAERGLSGLTLASKPLELLVGPEGGLTQLESERLENAGVTAVRMGPRVLRTETAGPAAIAALQVLAGDF